jgi:hypothetical protein
LESLRFQEPVDQTFLAALNAGVHSQALREFWPSGGPHWDALALVRGSDLPGCPSAGAHPPAGRRVAWGGVQLTARRLLRRRALQPERAQAVRAPSLVCYELIS